MPKLTLLFFFLPLLGISQGAYTVEVQQQTYEPLNSPSSIIDDLLPLPGLIPLSGTIELDLGFQFPYYDQVYNKININSGGAFILPDTGNYHMFLFTGLYWNYIPKTNPPYSDWLYKKDSTILGKRLTVEWHNMGLLYNEVNNISNTNVLTFRVSFYENGTVEMMTGPINITDTTFYSPTRGIIDESGEPFGPATFICNTNFEDCYGIGGEFTTPVITTNLDSLDIIKGFPTPGWTVRFIKKASNTSEIGNTNPDFTISPNPSPHGQTIFTFSSNGMLKIQDLSGRTIHLQEVNTGTTPIVLPGAGVYFCTYLCGDKMHTKKLIILSSR